MDKRTYDDKLRAGAKDKGSSPGVKDKSHRPGGQPAEQKDADKRK